MLAHERIEIAEFIPGVRIEIPSAPRALVLYQLTRALVEFCEISYYWREELDPIYIQPGIDTYELSPPSADTAIVSLLLVEDSDGNELEPLERTLDTDLQYWQDSSNEITVAPLDDLLDKQLKLTAAIKPTQDATTVSKNIYQDYHDNIVFGALGRLRMMAGREWTDPQLASVNLQQFRAGAEKAERRSARGFKAKPVRYKTKNRPYF